MYEWRETRSAEIAWVRFGDTLVHVAHITFVEKSGDGVNIHFSNKEHIHIKDTPSREVAELLGFKTVEDPDSATQP